MPSLSVKKVNADALVIEDKLRVLAAGDRVVELLMTIPGCWEISAWTIRAYTDDIKRFSSSKKYTAYAGLVPWVQNSNGTVRHGRITKRSPEELRTALVQVVMGLCRMTKTCAWRLMERYGAMKLSKGSGKTITATAGKMAVIIRDMLTGDAAFDVGKMTDRGLERKSSEMGVSATTAEAAGAEKEEPAKRRSVEVKEPGVAGKNGKKPGSGLLAG
jgi:hypothetical protein